MGFRSQHHPVAVAVKMAVVMMVGEAAEMEMVTVMRVEEVVG
jgi:hypothetical protein